MSMHVVRSGQILAKSASALRSSDVNRVGIGHALVDDFSFEQACSAIIDHARRGGRPAFVTTPNAQHVVLLEKSAVFRKIYDDADLVVADGVSLLFAARLYGRYLRERVSGVDLFVRLCELAANHKLRVFLLGGRPGSADLAAAFLRKSFPGLQCGTYCPPYGFEGNSSDLSSVAYAVQAYQPHLLFVGFGAPKQEQWIYEHGLQLSVPVSLGIGGSFEMVGGIVKRAPKWVQGLACEWLYRLCAEPRRMWPRYLIGNLEFADIVLRQRMRRILLNTCIRLADKEAFGAELQELMPLQEGVPAQIVHALEQQMQGTSELIAI